MVTEHKFLYIISIIVVFFTVYNYTFAFHHSFTPVIIIMYVAERGGRVDVLTSCVTRPYARK